METIAVVFYFRGRSLGNAREGQWRATAAMPSDDL